MFGGFSLAFRSGARSGGPVEIELEGIVRIFGVDRTAVYFDARPAAEFARGTITGAHNVPADALNDDTLEKAPLPRNDFNTRLIIFGRDGTQARVLADAIGKTPFQNVSYFPGPFEELLKAAPGHIAPCISPLRPAARTWPHSVPLFGPSRQVDAKYLIESQTTIMSLRMLLEQPASLFASRLQIRRRRLLSFVASKKLQAGTIP